MLSRRTIGRRIAGRLARIGTALALATGLVTAINFGAAQPALAEQSCPTTAVGDITQWIEQYKDRGVTVCWGMETSGGLPQLAAVVQVVDLADGADVRLASSRICPGGCALPYTPDQQFEKLTAEDWHARYDYPGMNLFSTTNAGFFTDTTNPTTKLSLPQLALRTVDSYGYAFYGGPDLTRAKVSLTLGSPADAFQAVRLRDFGPVYGTADVRTHWGCNPTYGNQCTGGFNGTIGFHPAANLTGNPDDIARRTMVGVNAQVNVAASRVYILTTTRAMKLADARQVLKHFGSQYEVQLDGGGSTSSISDYHQIDSTIFRPVPQVLQVYLGN